MHNSIITLNLASICPLLIMTLKLAPFWPYIFCMGTMNYSVGKLGLSQAEQDCTPVQLIVLHCTAAWWQPGLIIVNKSMKSFKLAARLWCADEWPRVRKYFVALSLLITVQTSPDTFFLVSRKQIRLILASNNFKRNDGFGYRNNVFFNFNILITSLFDLIFILLVAQLIIYRTTQCSTPLIEPPDIKYSGYIELNPFIYYILIIIIKKKHYTQN